jgi:hypothetical protein
MPREMIYIIGFTILALLGAALILTFVLGKLLPQMPEFLCNLIKVFKIGPFDPTKFFPGCA